MFCIFSNTVPVHYKLKTLKAQLRQIHEDGVLFSLHVIFILFIVASTVVDPDPDANGIGIQRLSGSGSSQVKMS